ncbi:3'-5' exonuclease [Rhodovulum sp. DZ06]|uniref:3'-5' exonuclease n=1 Tax=Rhodovulum sp. DZ06 TaxID=3425126 RepID=UPI003D33BDDE
MHWLPQRNKLDSDQNDACDACLSAILAPSPGDPLGASLGIPSRASALAPVRWVQGSAGTGKTVVLVHALREAKRRAPNLSMVFVTYTHALKALVADGLDDDTRRSVHVMTAHEFKNTGRNCSVLFVDEVQDLKPDMISDLRRRCSKMVIGGDPIQTIYDESASPEDISRIVSAQPIVLDIMYRLTRNLLAIAASIHPAARLQDARLSRLRNVDVMLGQAETLEQEADWVWRRAREGAQLGSPTAILLPTHKEIRNFLRRVAQLEGLDDAPFVKMKEYDEKNAVLAAAGLPLQYLGNGHGDLEDSNRRKMVYLMTYHSAKGLDFEQVYLPCLTPKLSIHYKDPDLASRLLYVAVTRAREGLFLTRTGPGLHPLVAQIPDALFSPVAIGAEEDEESDDDVYF